MSDLISFLAVAPYWMIAAFTLTFTITKLAQSERVYDLVSGALAEKRHARIKRLLAEMQEAQQQFLRSLGAQDERKLNAKQRKVLEQIRQSYYAELGSLYKKGDRENGRTASMQ
jgi:hypothetical protein